MGPSASELANQWRSWLVERNRSGLRVALLISMVLYPAFGLLDWALAPVAALPALLGTRCFIAVAAVAMYRVLDLPWFERNAPAASAAWVWLAAAGISTMTTYMGGLASPYYAGLTLPILAAGLLFVWPPRVVATAQAAIVGSFVLANVLAGTIGAAPTALSNLAFLSAVALIAGIGQVLLYRSQREQHAQRMRLEHATASLERAHVELQRVDELKSRFFANITHELRTPLAMVLAPLELLMDGEHGELSPAQRSQFQTMFRSSLKLLKLINDLLDLSRLEESRLRLEVQRHDVVAYLRGLAEQTEVLARRKDVSLTFRTAVDRAEVWCDLERLERVFVNLLSNAIKFTPPGGHVELSVRDVPEGVEVVVQDDGPGFPPDQASRIFERFYQVETAGTRQHGGAGIGLALARELVGVHAGRIEAESDGAHGARFTVWLRRGRAHFREDVLVADETVEGGREADMALDWATHLVSGDEFRLLDIQEATERRIVERDPDERARPHTALVVEDSAPIVRLVHQSLRREFRILAAPDGLKGLALALRERPDLVITDLMMPGVDGLELTRRLRADPRTRHIPVVMLSARGDLDDRVHGLETGVSAYLTKPFSPKELLTCARRLVQATQQTAALVLDQRMESVEIVAAGLAHEINNPLNYVKNALARVRLDAEDALALAARERPLEGAEAARLERIAARVRDLLAVADSGLKRIAGTVELMGRYGRAGFRRDVAPYDAWQAAREVVGVVLPATGRKVAVELDLSGDGVVACVPEELNQVITNLVQNAIEAAPDPGGRVRLRGAAEGEWLVLSVADNGPGIDPEARARLFTPFFTTKGPGRGVGLGLTITRRVVQTLRGSIDVVSSPGQGAEFVVRLPRAAAGEPRAPA
jgi:signal transduction histidine kinase